MHCFSISLPCSRTSRKYKNMLGRLTFLCYFRLISQSSFSHGKPTLNSQSLLTQIHNSQNIQMFYSFFKFSPSIEQFQIQKFLRNYQHDCDPSRNILFTFQNQHFSLKMIWHTVFFSIYLFHDVFSCIPIQNLYLFVHFSIAPFPTISVPLLTL